VVRRRELTEILQPRAEELFEMIRDDLQRVGCDGPPRGGVVLTGGGAQLSGLLEMSEQIFSTRVRYGLPTGLGGLIEVINSPTWTTAAGLLCYAVKAEQALGRRRQGGWSVRGVVGSLRGMISDLL
jgi:cell division protein FtsA